MEKLNALDLIPGVSTALNATCLLYKLARKVDAIANPQERALDFKIYAIQKSSLRCFIGLVPVIGNIACLILSLVHWLRNTPKQNPLDLHLASLLIIGDHKEEYLPLLDQAFSRDEEMFKKLWSLAEDKLEAYDVLTHFIFALVPDHKNFKRNLRPDFSAQRSAELDGNLHQVVESEHKAGQEKMGQILENFCGRVLDQTQETIQAHWSLFSEYITPFIKKRWKQNLKTLSELPSIEMVQRFSSVLGIIRKLESRELFKSEILLTEIFRKVFPPCSLRQLRPLLNANGFKLPYMDQQALIMKCDSCSLEDAIEQMKTNTSSLESISYLLDLAAEIRDGNIDDIVEHLGELLKNKNSFVIHWAHRKLNGKIPEVLEKLKTSTLEDAPKLLALLPNRSLSFDSSKELLSIHNDQFAYPIAEKCRFNTLDEFFEMLTLLEEKKVTIQGSLIGHYFSWRTHSFDELKRFFPIQKYQLAPYFAEKCKRRTCSTEELLSLLSELEKHKISNEAQKSVAKTLDSGKWPSFDPIFTSEVLDKTLALQTALKAYELSGGIRKLVEQKVSLQTIEEDVLAEIPPCDFAYLERGIPVWINSHREFIKTDEDYVKLADFAWKILSEKCISCSPEHCRESIREINIVSNLFHWDQIPNQKTKFFTFLLEKTEFSQMDLMRALHSFVSSGIISVFGWIKERFLQMSAHDKLQVLTRIEIYYPHKKGRSFENGRDMFKELLELSKGIFSEGELSKLRASIEKQDQENLVTREGKKDFLLRELKALKVVDIPEDIENHPDAPSPFVSKLDVFHAMFPRFCQPLANLASFSV